MAPRVDPILLWGFCFNKQKQQIFNNSWACAWHTSWYTDEHHAIWDYVDDPSKRREIRYGNNIAVLFGVLLHCRKFWGQSNFWSAIARGFNTNATIAKATAEILTEARRIQRSKPAKEVSETARAADQWIDFLDSQPPHPRMLLDPELYLVADVFFKTQEKQLVNAGRVPINQRYSAHFNFDHMSHKGPLEPVASSPRLPAALASTAESPGGPADKSRLPQPNRKRSASPLPSNRSPKSSRLDHGVNGQPRTGPETQGQQDHAPQIHPARAELIQAKPTQSRPQPSQPQPIHGKAAQPQPQAKSSKGKGEVCGASGQLIVEETSALKARIACLEKQLEKQLAQTKQHEPSSAPAAPSAEPLGQNILGDLKKDMATVANVVGTMMESMHDIVDSFSSLQEEVSALSDQQKESAAAHSQTGKLDTLVNSIQALTDSVKLVREEVSGLKEQAPAQQQQPAAVSCSAAGATSELKTLMQEQGSRIEKLARQLASVQAQAAVPAANRPAPTTLRQAVDVAERDLKHHITALHAFYHRLDGTQGSGRMVTERTADLLATLQQSHDSAQTWQAGGSS